MGFQRNQEATASNVTDMPQRGRNDNWQADAFLNIYVPTNSGGRRKLGYVALKNNRPSERALIERLTQNPDDIEALRAAIEIDFNLAEGSESSQFAF